jgi:hypothetical protein
MLYNTAEIDAHFYRLIHQLAESQASPDRRRALRHPFSVTQRIAPRRGQGFPEDSEFLPVQCHDLSQSGFSFLMLARPDFTSLVAAFGNPPEVIYVAAEVSHCTEVVLDRSGVTERVHDQTGRVIGPSADGQTATRMVLVGCRFTQRLGK